MSRLKGIADLFTSRLRRRAPARRRQPARQPAGGVRALETLEPRAMLAVSYAYDDVTNALTVNMTGSDNSAVIEFGVLADGPAADSVSVLGARLSAPGLTETVLVPVNAIVINVADPDVATNNRVSFGIIPFDNAFDLSSFVYEGSGASGLGHFTCSTSALKAVCSLNLTNIDAVSFSQADEIRIDGTFSNDTGDAEVGVVWQSLEPDVTEVIIGTNRPLVADTIRVESAKSITFFNPVTATSDLTLRSNSPLDIDYDLEAGGTLVLDGTDGVTQRASATIVAPALKVVSRAGTTTTGIVSLESDLNDFDTVQISSDTSGQISLRDVDDLVVSESGISADAGRVVLDVRGALTIASTILALGLNAQSGASVLATPTASMTLGEDGLQIYATDSFDELASGDVTLNAPIRIQAADETKLVSNKIRSAGATLIAGGLYAPSAGITTIEAGGDLVVAGPIQVGSTKLDANSTTATVFDHDLTLVSHAGVITVEDVPGNDAVPSAIQATNIISFDAAKTIDIRGTVFAGSRAGDATSRTASEALPAITIVGDADVVIAATGSLQTQAYENDAATFANPLLGRISIDAATQFDLQGAIRADGPVDVSSTGDVYLYGPLTARESVAVETSGGSIDVQAAVRTTGWTYTSAPPAVLVTQRLPNILLSAPGGAISTSGLGTLSAGVMTTNALTPDPTEFAGATVAGLVELQAQQDIQLAADVVTAGGFTAGSQVGAFSLNALLQTANGQAVSIDAATGIEEVEFGRIVTDSLTAINRAAGDIVLVSHGNKIASLDIVNHAEAGLVGVSVDGATTVSQLRADGEVTIGTSGLLTIAGVLRSDAAGIRLDVQSGLLQRDASGLSVITVIAGGGGYAPNAVLTIAAPQGGGRAATAVPVIGEGGVVIGVTLTDPGSGYAIGEKPQVTLDDGDGDGSGAAFDASGPSSLGGILAKTDIFIESRGDVTILGTVASSEQEIKIALAEGNVVLGGASLLIAQGPATLEAVAGGVSVGGEVRADAVNVNVTSGAFTVLDNAAIVATAESIQVSLANQSTATISGDMVAETDVTVVGQLAGVSVTGLLEAKNGDIKIEALTVTQSTETGITKCEVLSGGRGYDLGAIILVPPPTSGTGRPARAEAVIENGAIVSVTIVDPGSGYAVGQKIRIVVQGIEGPPTKDGPGAPGGQGAVVLAYGPAAVKDLTARNGKVSITANQDVALSSQLLASTLIEVRSKHGTVDLSASSSFLNVLDLAGEVVVRADQGAVKINRAEAGGDITLEAQGDVAFSGRIITTNGDFVATSELAQAVFKGAEVFAEEGSFRVVAGGYVLQESDSGIAKVEIVSGGQGYSEDTALEIAAPRNGGVPATAVLAMGENGVIVGVTITNSGSGYEPGESPEVKIVDPVSDGGFNGFLRAFGPENVRQVKARNIDIEAGLGVRLGTAFEAVNGKLTVVSKSGTVDLGVGSVSLNASDSVTVTAESGNVLVQRIVAGTGVELDANLTIKVLGRVVANGDEGIQIRSTLGQVVVGNTLLAKLGAISVDAGGTFEQRNESGITGIEVLNAGNGYSREVQIDIAAPRNGGITARAVPILDDRGGIARVLVIDPGSGYEVGESPAVNVIEQNVGPDGDGGVNAALTAVGPREQYDIEAQLGIAITANLGVRGGGGLISQSRGIEVKASSGTVDFSQGAAFLRALDPENGVVTINAPEGLVLAPQSSVGKSLDVSASGGVIINGDLVGVQDNDETNVTLYSSGGVVDLSGGDVAIDGQLKVVGGRVRQLGASGVQKLRIASGGEEYTQRVTIEIDPPASGFGRAAKATAIVQQGVIVDTVITDPGSGYAIGESPLVTVRGETQFSINGDPFEVGAGAAIFAVGPTEIRDVRADAGVEIESVGDVALSSQFRSNSGAFKVKSILGDIDLAEGSFVADANGIEVTATLGSVKVELLNARNDGVNIEAGGAVDLNGGLLSVGDVTIASGLGNIDITGAAISVEDGDLRLAAADGGVIQQETTGITQIELIEGGEGYFSSATVTVAAPSAPGGRQATAEAVVRAGRIVRIVVTDPGSGYAPGEQPRVTIQGENGANGSPEGRGALALARAPGAVRNINALNGTIQVQSGADSSLTSIFTARDIEVSSKRGDVNLGGGTLFLNAVGGSVVAAADRGRVSVRRISADTDVTLTGHIDVTVSSRVDATNGAITVNSTGGGMTLRNFLAGEQIKAVALSNTSLEGYFKSGSNDIDVESTFGAILLNADLKADAGAVRLAAFSDVYQGTSTGITAIEVTSQGDGFEFGAQVVVAAPRNNPDGLAARLQANVRRVDFVVGFNTITRWFIDSIDIVFPGVGYAIGENPDVQILVLNAAGDPVGLGGAEARATGPTGPRKITAAEDIEVTAGGKVTFVQPLESSNGNIAVRTTGGELNVGATQLIAREGGVVVDATVGSALVNDVLAKTDIVIKSRETLQLTGLIDTAAGSVEIISFAGDVVFKDGAVIDADLGDVTLASPNGQVSAPPVLNVGGSVDISSFKTLRLESEIVAATGDVDVNVASGSLVFSGNIVASTGSVSLRSDSATVTQVDSSGIRFIAVLAGGSNYTGDVRVVIAAPAGGGVTAEARATVGTAEDGTVGAILEITISNPGSGYAVNESPAVTITPANPGQGSGAVALATGPSGLANVLGWNGVTIAGAAGVTLVNAVRSPMGDITIQSASGSLDMAADTFLAHAAAGGVTLAANVGVVTGTAIRAASDIAVTAESVLLDTVVSSGGGVDVTGATSFTLVQGKGDVNVAGDFVATTVGSTLGNVTVLGARSLSSVFAGQVADVSGVSIGSVEAGTDAIVRGTEKVGSVTAGQDASVTAPAVSNVSAGLDAKVSGADVRNVEAVRDVSIRNTGDMTASGLVRSETGDVSILSDAGSVTLWARVIAEIGMVTVEAQTGVTQVESTGLTSIDVVLAGSVTSTTVPVVTVTVAAPGAVGGRAATAEAILQTSLDANGDTVYSLERIVLIDRGAGYAAGESPAVTITGLPGAAAVAAGPLAAQSLWAGNGILVAAGEDVALTRPMTATGGDIDIISTTGDLVLNADTFFAHAMAGGVTLTSDCGSVVVERVCAQDDVTITGPQGVIVEDEIRSDSGSVTMTVDAGPATVQDIYALDRISLTAAQDIRVLGLVQADQDLIRLESSSGLIDVLRSVVSRGGSIEIISTNNAVNVRQLNAKQDVTVSGFKTSTLVGEIVATKGDVNATSTAGGLRLNANIVAGDDITLEAQTFLEQLNRTGIEALQIISEGSDRQVTLEPVPPDVTVTIAAPAAAGGRAATARAILGRRFLGNDPGGTDPIYEYFIDKVEIIDAGAGYAIGESPIVTITGMPGAVVRGIGPTNLRNITARNNLTIHAEDDMTLLYRLTANKGDLSISSVSGDIDLGSKLLRMTVPGAKGDVSITTESGSIILPPVINIAGDITLRSFAPLTIGQQLTTSGGDVRLTSTAGSLAVNANVFAADRIELSSKLGITQNGGFMKAAELKATNMNTAGITLGSQGNDVDRFAATNVGDVSYTDADDFRVGLQTSGTMGVEVTGNFVSLSSVAPDSIIRVVAGMNYRRLNIAAGTLGGDDVGMVEFVVTSPVDSTSTAFSGRLRDMITYVSDNRASYVDDGATLPQPMTVVFDEPGYVISEIQVASSLPAFRRPVLFDGGRVADSVASGRLGIRGSATAPTGITLAAGSGGSTIRETALYGFSKGSAAVLESPRNTVIDTYFGIQADGVTTSANLVGVNLSGSLSRLNTIGSKTYDAQTANKFAASTDAGILIQQGAFGNLVVGNEIGIAGLAKNRDGVRIDGSNGNRIGSEEQLTPDLSPIFSNRITNNARHGVSIVNTQGTGVPDANRVQNNFVGDNAGHGVSVQTGTNVVIGGESRFHANVFAKNAGSGVYLGSATRVNVVGNHIGVDAEAKQAMGNGRMGVEVAVGSGSVRIEKNRISANTTNGVGITSRTSGVVITDNVIGGLLEDGTAVGNKFDGVLILNANGNIVGKGNLISQNLRSGVNVTSADAANLAAGNRIFGSEIIHNEQHGVRITGSNRVTVGGATEDLGNLIYGNKQDGVRIERHPTARTPATGNVIVNNFIGTNEFADVAADTENTGFDNDPIFNNGFGYPVPLGNANGIVIVQGNANQVRGNTIMNNGQRDEEGKLIAGTGSGIEVRGGNGNVIGGATETFANSISHNLGDGIFIADRPTAGGPTPVATSNVTVSGNAITNNGGDGIEVVGSKVAVVTIGQNVTGQTVTGLPNTIQENAGNAVVVDGGQRVSLNGNAIAGEIVVQHGANAGSAAPIALGSTIDVVRRSNSQLVISGTITGPTTARYERYLVDVFHKDPFDPSAMRTFLGRHTVVTDENGRATFEFTINASIEVGDEICLSATSLVYQPGATSLLGDCTVHALPGPTPGSGTQGPQPPTRVPNP